MDPQIAQLIVNGISLGSIIVLAAATLLLGITMVLDYLQLQLMEEEK